MNAMSVYYSYRNPAENFFKFSPSFMYPCHSQITKIDATTMLFIKFPDLQLHYDPMFDSLYITGTCHFRLYFFACRDFAIPLFRPLFDLVASYIACPFTWPIQHPQQHHQHLPYHLRLFPSYPLRVTLRRMPPPRCHSLLLATVTLQLTQAW